MLVATIKEKLSGIQEELAAQTDRGAAIKADTPVGHSRGSF